MSTEQSRTARRPLADPSPAASRVPEVRVVKPPIPLIWLDTWMFNAFGRMRAGILAKDEERLFRALFDVLLELRDKVAIICPETGQFVEIHPVGWSIEEAKSALSMVSGGVKTHYQVALDAQIYRGMQAYAAGSYVIELNFREAFSRDPLRELGERDILIRVDLEPPPEELAATRARNAATAAAIETLRQQQVAARVTLAQQIERELDAERDVTIELIRQVLVPMSQGRPPASMDALLKYALMVGRPARMLGEMLETATGKRDDYNDLLAFYRSEHYRSLPGPRIRAELFARKIVGAETIQPGDVMDIHQIAAYLPFATYVVLDKSMARKVEEAGLGERYGVRVFKRRTLPELVSELQDLARLTPARRPRERRPVPARRQSARTP